MQTRLYSLLPCAALLAAPFAHAQAVEGTVHIEYAEVLRVEPVYLPIPPPDDAAQCAPMLQTEPEPADQQAVATDTDCILLQNDQHESAPTVVYDVDYVLHGVKYRSRLPYDPGNHLQVRLSVTPILSLPEEPPPPPT